MEKNVDGKYSYCFSFSKFFLISVHFSCSVVSDSLWSHGLQHTRLPSPSPTPRACLNSCPSRRWSSNHLILCRPLLLPSVFPSILVFSNEPVLHIRWSKNWNSPSASVLPMNIQADSFRIDWFDILAIQGTLKSLLQCHSSEAPILWHLTFFMVQQEKP